MVIFAHLTIPLIQEIYFLLIRSHQWKVMIKVAVYVNTILITCHRNWLSKVVIDDDGVETVL